MYSVKVQEGRERAALNRISGAFLPTYIRAASSSHQTKELLLPGYVFTMDKTDHGEKISDEDYHIISILASKELSIVNRAGKVLAGPLKEIEKYIVYADWDFVLIKVRLLDKLREYYVRVLPPEKAGMSRSLKASDAPDQPSEPPVPPSAPDEAQDAAQETAKKQQKIKEKTQMPEKNTTFTNEQIRSALELEARIGNRDAAAQLHIPWQLLAQWKKRAAKDPSIAPRSNIQQATDTETKEEFPQPHEAGAPAAETSADRPASALEIENAVLKEQVATLTARVAKLTKALQDLLN